MFDRHKAELLKQQQLVVHQVEGYVLAVAEAEHLDIVQGDGAASGWNVASRGVENAMVGSCERALLDVDAGAFRVIELTPGVGPRRGACVTWSVVSTVCRRRVSCAFSCADGLVMLAFTLR